MSKEDKAFKIILEDGSEEIVFAENHGKARYKYFVSKGGTNNNDLLKIRVKRAKEHDKNVKK